MDRIISKEEEREDPRRDTSIYLRVQVQWCFHNSTRTTVKSTRIPSKFSSHPVQETILHTELILLQEILQEILQGSSRAHPVQIRLLPATVPRVSKHSTRQNKAPGSLTSTPGPYSTSRLPVILPGRNSILSGSQHPHSPYSSS